ncbi:hypothetical protein A2160_04390 [Candidatus Beckwithbacteria bacterium RBG_13_42_9]|uniref:Uncharacterized protein n=1 Tax=Candidatus Beckwithbacteria bacterium RBG_13_42_9 TaxID=1797457 RepID=A0A1F5E6G9_9BACT|nr:MAG: hypothetical protein A2160_04390 [Candidatus Beckwithbacteria bacterium RBG_13_42_9]
MADINVEVVDVKHGYVGPDGTSRWWMVETCPPALELGGLNLLEEGIQVVAAVVRDKPKWPVGAEPHFAKVSSLNHIVIVPHLS